MPKSLNALMKHLRNSGINIGGSTQKRKLKNIGYYHGYKGYRFVGEASNRLPLTDFSQVIALNDFDMQLKSLFYPRMMQVETALKNYTLEAVLKDSGSASFDIIWRKCLTGYRNYKGNGYAKAIEKRLRLRRDIDGLVFRNHRNRDVIRHFHEADKEIPVWALFEVMTLGNFGAFYECLDVSIKDDIEADVGLPSNYRAEQLLKDVIFLLHDFRNAIAHNGVILDVRFRKRNINASLTKLIKQETGIDGVDFTDITDYAVLLVFLMKRMGFTKTECRQLIAGFESTIEKYRQELPFNIYSRIIKSTARRKLTAARHFVSAL